VASGASPHFSRDLSSEFRADFSNKHGRQRETTAVRGEGGSTREGWEFWRREAAK